VGVKKRHPHLKNRVVKSALREDTGKKEKSLPIPVYCSGWAAKAKAMEARSRDLKTKSSELEKNTRKKTTTVPRHAHKRKKKGSRRTESSNREEGTIKI